MTWSAITDSGTWEAIPLELSVDLCILAKNGWAVTLRYPLGDPAGYNVMSRRGQWLIAFEYWNHLDRYAAGRLNVYRQYELVPVRDLNRLEMRRAAILSDEALDLEVVRG